MNSQQFISARKDQELAVLEGFHAFKHALRFGVEIVDVITPDKSSLLEMANKLAPEEAEKVLSLTREVTADEYNAAAPIPPRTGVLAVAKRRNYPEDVIYKSNQPIVWLDNPRDHENIGAIIRLGAGLGAGAVVVSGDIDIWNPAVLRGSAGLHFALPVIKSTKSPKNYSKKVYVFDDQGVPISDVNILEDSIVVFGSERDGVSEQVKNEADEIVAIPMQSGVSSLNLATSAAIGLYTTLKK